MRTSFLKNFARETKVSYLSRMQRDCEKLIVRLEVSR